MVLPPLWAEILPGTALESLADIRAKVDRARHSAPIAPAQDKVFAALERVMPDQVKVVLIGQDPYHTPGLAQGLAFSIPGNIPMGSRQFPSSLRNINKALKIEGFGGLKNGDLSHWADQGVLLLNATLTVDEGNANSHAGFGWQEFTDSLIKALSERHESIVWMLWGSFAQKKISLIDPNRGHLVLMASHPSGLSVYKTDAPFLCRGDTDCCRHFSRANEWLEKFNRIAINWV